MKKIILPISKKDDSGAFIKEGPATILPPEPAPSDIDIADLLSKTLEILRREVKHLLMESSAEKLHPNSARDLVNYVKLLSELHSEEKDLLDTLTDDELKEILNKRNAKAE